jgi:hypothetical protein
MSTIVKKELESRPLLQVMLNSTLINVRALARELRPDVERQLGQKVDLETIAMALRRTADNQDVESLNSLLLPPACSLLMTYHQLVAINFPKGHTGSETIPDSVRFFAQTTGSNEHSIIISQEDRQLLDTTHSLRVMESLSALCIELPQDSASIENLYAKIFLLFGMKSISFVEVISTFNELTLVIKADDYDRAYEVIKKLRPLA